MNKISNLSVIDKIIILSIAGVLFSGYLSSVKLFSKTCAIDSGCSYFLGYPTCYYGFVFFVLILLSSLTFKFCKWGGRKMQTARLHLLRTFTFIGIIFSAYWSFVEIAKMISEKIVYGALILPTCFYGLIVYVAVFYLSFKLKLSQPSTKGSDAQKENSNEPENQ